MGSKGAMRRRRRDKRVRKRSEMWEFVSDTWDMCEKRCVSVFTLPRRRALPRKATEIIRSLFFGSEALFVCSEMWNTELHIFILIFSHMSSDGLLLHIPLHIFFFYTSLYTLT